MTVYNKDITDDRIANDTYLETYKPNLMVGYNPATKEVIEINVDNNGAISTARDDATRDAFQRLRVSNPQTLLDFKQLVDGLPLFFDESETSGSGTTTSYLSNKASTRIGVGATTAGTRVRQSKLWGNYQPGKSQLIFITFANSHTATGNTKMAGYYNDQNGIYHKHEEGTAKVGIRAYNTGSAVDTDVAQSSWNIDTMDGTGTSGIQLDFTKTQIFVIDFEWLGVGRVRVGWVIDGKVYYCHEFLHTNTESEVYMSTPNLPIRYEIQNDGNGAADTFDTICSSVMSEGGQQLTAIDTYIGRGGTSITLANQDLWTPLVSLRLKSTHLCTRITPKDIAVFLSSATNYEWGLFINPTIAGTDAVSWTNLTNSSLQYDVTRNNTNTLTGGYQIAGGYGASSNQVKGVASAESSSFLTIGSAIDGTQDELVLAVRNIDGNGGTAYGSITVSEYC